MPKFSVTPPRLVGLNPPGPLPSYDVPGLRALLREGNTYGWDCLALAMALTHDEVMSVVNETPPLADGTTDRESVTTVLEALVSIDASAELLRLGEAGAALAERRAAPAGTEGCCCSAATLSGAPGLAASPSSMDK